MIRLLISILFVFLLVGCKSTKKLKQTSALMEAVSVDSVSLDSSVNQVSVESGQVQEEEVTEEHEDKFVPLDSAGFTVFKPVSITRKKTKVLKTSNSSSDTTETSHSSDRSSSNSSSQEDFKDLDKASEGIDPIEEVASALFPTWGKILASILVAVVPVLWGFFKKTKH